MYRIDEIVGGDRRSKRIAGGEALNSGDVPIAERKLQRFPGAGPEPLALSVRKIVNGDQIPGVGNVVSGNGAIAGSRGSETILAAATLPVESANLSGLESEALSSDLDQRKLVYMVKWRACQR